MAFGGEHQVPLAGHDVFQLGNAFLIQHFNPLLHELLGSNSVSDILKPTISIISDFLSKKKKPPPNFLYRIWRKSASVFVHSAKSGRPDGQARVSAEASSTAALARLGPLRKGRWRYRPGLDARPTSQYACRRVPASGARAHESIEPNRLASLQFAIVPPKAGKTNGVFPSLLPTAYRSKGLCQIRRHIDRSLAKAHFLLFRAEWCENDRDKSARGGCEFDGASPN